MTTDKTSLEKEKQPSCLAAVVCSAYYVHISGMGETCIVAEILIKKNTLWIHRNLN